MCVLFFFVVMFALMGGAVFVAVTVIAKKEREAQLGQQPYPPQLYPPQPPYPGYQQAPPQYQQAPPQYQQAPPQYQQPYPQPGYPPQGPVGHDAGYPGPAVTVQPWGPPGSINPVMDTIPGAPAGASPAGRGPQTRVVTPEMVYLQGPTGAMEALPEGETSVGRDDDNAIMVVDGGASRHHASVRRAGMTVSITDLGSGNGTYVNDVRIAPSVPCQVRQGDRVRFGGPSIYVVGGAT